MQRFAFAVLALLAASAVAQQLPTNLTTSGATHVGGFTDTASTYGNVDLYVFYVPLETYEYSFGAYGAACTGTSSTQYIRTMIRRNYALCSKDYASNFAGATSDEYMFCYSTSANDVWSDDGYLLYSSHTDQYLVGSVYGIDGTSGSSNSGFQFYTDAFYTGGFTGYYQGPAACTYTAQFNYTLCPAGKVPIDHSSSGFDGSAGATQNCVSYTNITVSAAGTVVAPSPITFTGDYELRFTNMPLHTGSVTVNITTSDTSLYTYGTVGGPASYNRGNYFCSQSYYTGSAAPYTYTLVCDIPRWNTDFYVQLHSTSGTSNSYTLSGFQATVCAAGKGGFDCTGNLYQLANLNATGAIGGTGQPSTAFWEWLVPAGSIIGRTNITIVITSASGSTYSAIRQNGFADYQKIVSELESSQFYSSYATQSYILQTVDLYAAKNVTWSVGVYCTAACSASITMSQAAAPVPVAAPTAPGTPPPTPVAPGPQAPTSTPVNPGAPTTPGAPVAPGAPKAAPSSAASVVPALALIIASLVALLL